MNIKFWYIKKENFRQGQGGANAPSRPLLTLPLYVRIPIHLRTWVAWNQMIQTPSLPLRVDSTIHCRKRRSVRGHAWAPQVGQHPRMPVQVPLPPIQRNMQVGSNSAMSSETLPEAIFRFLDLSEINLALREEDTKPYIIMFFNQNIRSCTGQGSVNSNQSTGSRWGQQFINASLGPQQGLRGP